MRLARLVYNPFYRIPQFPKPVLRGQHSGRQHRPEHGSTADETPLWWDIQWLRKPFLLTLKYVHSDGRL